jgi:glycosyltransferase involved in cell wall biosynthesis
MNKATIVVFTSNYMGGILQFTLQLGSTLCSMGYQTVVYVPDNSLLSEIENETANSIIKFRKQKNLGIKSKLSQSIARNIERLNPGLVLFSDETIVSAQVLLSLGKHVRTAMYVHDVVEHPGRFSIYEIFKLVFQKNNLKHVFKATDRIILLSKNSYALFKSCYPAYADKAIMMPLGAHLPEVKRHRPAEISDLDQSRYYLFFGRFGRYKGIIRLLKAYQAITAEKPLLIIAGSGTLEKEERALIEKDDNVRLINRYIENAEALYLISNALTVILPYIEASQSGVLPIAYSCKVPVVTSNVAGLIEFVEDGVTGIICSNIEEMTEALKQITEPYYRDQLGAGAYQFYKEKLDWGTNLINCIEPLIKQ